MQNLSVKHETIPCKRDKTTHIAKQGSGKKLVPLLHGMAEFWVHMALSNSDIGKTVYCSSPDLRGV